MKVNIFNKIIFENKIILLMTFIAIEVVAKFKHEIARGKRPYVQSKGKPFWQTFYFALVMKSRLWIKHTFDLFTY